MPQIALPPTAASYERCGVPVRQPVAYSTLTMAKAHVRRYLADAQRVVIDQRQRLAKRIATSDLELRHQANYFELAGRTSWLEEPPLSSLNGGTASYSLLYVLLALLRSERFHSILELGVGRSTQLIAPYVAAGSDRRSVHVESDDAWLSASLPSAPRIQGLHAPLVETIVDGKRIEWYGCDRPDTQFDLVIIDGPAAWHWPNRYNRLGVLRWLPEILADEFVICIDDTARAVERRLASLVAQLLREKRPEARSMTFTGATSQTLFATSLFQWALYL